MGDAQMSSVFQVGDKFVDGWGNEVDEPDKPVEYQSWTGKALIAEVDRRNEDRDEDTKIQPAGKKKSDYVDALEKDDAEAEDTEED